MPNKQNLTGWLILLMIILGFGSFSGIGRAITEVRESYEPYFLEYPSLPTAVFLYQILLFGSACAAFYTVWILYQRLPGTLFIAKRGFVATIVLRIAAGSTFDLVAGLPDELRETVMTEVIRTLVVAGYGTVWYLYLAHSKRVREIYAIQCIAPHKPQSRASLS